MFRSLDMRRIFASLACIAMVTNVLAIEVEDDLGNRVRLDKPAMRIVSLAPHITENLFAAGAGEKIVAVSAYSDYPLAATKLTQVAGVGGLDIERIAALQPDLVVAWWSGNPQGQVERLLRLGIPVYQSEPRRLQDIAKNLLDFGALTGRSEVAARTVAQFRNEIAGLAEQYAEVKRLRVFFQIWNEPLTTVNGEHMISEVITLCGGENVFAGLTSLAGAVDLESVLVARPDVIVASSPTDAAPPWLNEWQSWPTLPAVKNNNLFYVHADLINRSTPRIVEGARRLCRAMAAARVY